MFKIYVIHQKHFDLKVVFALHLITAVDQYLIFAMDSEVRSLHLDPNTLSQPFQPITGLNGARGLDFDYMDKKLYFSQIGDKKLSRADINSGVIEDFAVNANATGKL